MITSNTPIAAPCTCPVCGAVRRTEPVLPKLPRRGYQHPTDKAIWVTGDGRHITIA